MEVHHELCITTHCPVCAKMFTDPKILPCVHTFCSECLQLIASKANEMPGSSMQCPVCRKGFSVPQEGVAKLQHNYFVEWLVTLTRILNATNRLCDACMEGIDSSSALNIASVRTYCFNCSMKLCDDCWKHHRKSKLTETHKVIDVTNQAITVELMEAFSPSLCEQHRNEALKLYCTDCDCIICALCYIEGHQGHRFSDVKVAALEYRTKLQASVNDISTFVEHIQLEQRQLEEGKSEIVKKIGSIEKEVWRRRVQLTMLMEKHVKLLTTKLGSLKEGKLKEIEAKKEDFSHQSVCLESYKSYVGEVTDKATSAYICQAVKSMTARAVELKDINDKIIQRRLPPFEVSFWPTDLEEFFRSDNGNILGLIQADRPDHQMGTSKDRSAEATKELLTKIAQLTLEVKMEKLNSQDHQEKTRHFSQELDREKSSKCDLQELVDKLRQDLTRETSCNKNNRELIEKLRQNPQNKEDVASGKVSELEKAHREERQKWMMKEKLLNERVTELLQKVAVLNQTTVKVQKQLEDERKEKKALDTEIMKCRENEKEFFKEKTSFATKEKQLVEQLARQEKESNQLVSKLKQEAASELLLCNSLKAKQNALQDQQNILQAELHSVKKERDSQAACIIEATAIQLAERKEKTVAREQLKRVTSQLEQAEQEKLYALTERNADRNKILKAEEKLLECNETITNERQKFQKLHSYLGKLLYKQRPDTIDYKDMQGSVQKLNSVPFQIRTVTGLTVINSILYVTKEHSQIIEGYDSTTFVAKLKLSLIGLSNPRDIKGTRHNCLCIFDMKSHAQPKEILVVDLNVEAIQKRWSTGDDYGSLSIADEGNVILTVRKKNKLKEYTSDGQLVREITLSSTVVFPLHSLKLASGHFVVSHGGKSGICIVDETGEVLKSFGEEKNSWLRLCRPVCLVVDKRSCIMVADETSGRVLLLSSTLEFKDVLISRKHGLKSAIKIHLDESKGHRLFVADDCLKDAIHVFKFSTRHQPQHQRQHQPITYMMIEDTVQYFSSCLPNFIPESELDDVLVRVLQSQGTLRVARAIGEVAFLVLGGLLLFYLVFVGYVYFKMRTTM